MGGCHELASAGIDMARQDMARVAHGDGNRGQVGARTGIDQGLRGPRPQHGPNGMKGQGNPRRGVCVDGERSQQWSQAEVLSPPLQGGDPLMTCGGTEQSARTCKNSDEKQGRRAKAQRPRGDKGGMNRYR